MDESSIRHKGIMISPRYSNIRCTAMVLYYLYVLGNYLYDATLAYIRVVMKWTRSCTAWKQVMLSSQAAKSPEYFSSMPHLKGKMMEGWMMWTRKAFYPCLSLWIRAGSMCSVVLSQWKNCFGFLLMYLKGRSEEEETKYMDIWG